MSSVTNAVVSDATAASAAELRLALSRDSAARWLAEEARGDAPRTPSAGAGIGAGAGPDTGPGPSTGTGAGSSASKDRLHAHPLAELALDAASRWWRRQPAREPAHLIALSLRAVAAPLVQRHPFWVLGGAASAGALLVLARPWRWRPRATLVVGVATQLALQWFARHPPQPPNPPQPGV